MYRNSYITTPEEFAVFFNQKFPGAYRKITSVDIKHMEDCGLIRRYGFYTYKEEEDDFIELHGFHKQIDLETVRGVLQYEQFIGKMPPQQGVAPAQYLAKCKMCGRILLPEPGKPGRPKEYCADCDPKRARDRKNRSRHGSGKRYDK